MGIRYKTLQDWIENEFYDGCQYITAHVDELIDNDDSLEKSVNILKEIRDIIKDYLHNYKASLYINLIPQNEIKKHEDINNEIKKSYNHPHKCPNILYISKKEYAPIASFYKIYMTEKINYYIDDEINNSNYILYLETMLGLDSGKEDFFERAIVIETI